MEHHAAQRSNLLGDQPLHGARLKVGVGVFWSHRPIECQIVIASPYGKQGLIVRVLLEIRLANLFEHAETRSHLHRNAREPKPQKTLATFALRHDLPLPRFR